MTVIRCIITAIACLIGLGSGIVANAATGESVRREVIIVANNASLDKDVAPLSYTDDDAIKFHELFTAAGANITLLTVLDPDAQRRFPEVARVAIPPHRDALRKAVTASFERIIAAKAAGFETHFYFLYAGHGNVGPNREGYVNLLDHKLTRSELYRDIVSRSPANFNHLIIDACHSYFLVHKRGELPDRVGDFGDALRDFLASEDLASYPNTGVILAASRESETHEWGRWRAGLFSHELRSALLGAADVDGNGQISYDEAAACVEAANAGIDVPEDRLSVYYKPPSTRVDTTLFDIGALPDPVRLIFGLNDANRWHVEDSRGVRVADLHPSGEQSVRLALVGEAPFFLRSAEQEATIDDRSGEIRASDLDFSARTDSSRGSTELSFRRHLYRIPFGAGFYQGVLATRQHKLRSPTAQAPAQSAGMQTWPNTATDQGPGSSAAINSEDDSSTNLAALGWTSLGVAVLSGIGATAAYVAADRRYNDYQEAQDRDHARQLHTETDRALAAGHVMVSVASVLAVTGASLLIADAVRDSREERKISPAVSLNGTGGTVGVVGTW